LTTEWPKKIIEWTEERKAYLSIPFTWLLPKAFSRCVWYLQQGYEVFAGGPAVSNMPDVLKGVAHIGGELDALPRHNPDATFTSRGCVRKCEFCAVWRIEGTLRELDYWTPKPIVCDNNLLACSHKHFGKVIDSLKSIKGVDFNQGLDARLLSDYHIQRLKELDLALVRFAWDWTPSEPYVIGAIERMVKAGWPKSRIQVYVLFGHTDTPEDASYRFETLRNLKVRSNPMRYQPLDTMKRDSYISEQWTRGDLKRTMRYWARQNWLSKVPFVEYVG